MVKKTRPERPGANPYEAEPEPPNPYEVKPNPYQVKPEPAKPRPRTSNSARPNTPQQPTQPKKKSPVYPGLAESLSPLHSNRSSPANRASPPALPGSGRGANVQGYNVDSLGRPLSSSSDSNSSSGSDSDSDVDDPKPPKAPKAAPAPTSSMPDLLPGLGESAGVTARSGGTLPTARPPPPPPARPAPAPAPPVGSMPDIFGLADLGGPAPDLGDDLILSSDDSE